MSHDDAIDDVNQHLDRRQRIERAVRVTTDIVRGTYHAALAIMDLFTEPLTRSEQSE